MSNLFKKAIFFTDVHFGLKNNSVQHNNDCADFVDWMVALGKQEGCDTCFFLGDWHNNRASISLLTLNYSVNALTKLNDSFSQTFFIPGNHDLFYRDKRDVHGLSWARSFPNITIANDWFSEGDVVIAPWLVGDDHKKIRKQRGKYMMGHLELPSFMMNAAVEMPETGEFSVDDFGSFDTVFSGHFHMRQQKKNITYMGNAFPHNFSDAGDDRRGAMIVEWGQPPTYHTWDGQPVYRVFRLSDVLNDTDNLLRPNMYCKVNIDIDISYEEASFIRETFVEKYNVREMSLVPIKQAESAEQIGADIKFESVNQIVSQQIAAIKSEFYDPALLLEIYNRL